jgi:hypothetical protein
MKFLKNGLRTWVAITSIAGFLGGWAVFAHAEKPVSTTAQQQPPAQIQVPPLPTLPAIPSLSQPIQQVQPIQPIQPMPQINTFSRMRTGGS